MGGCRTARTGVRLSPIAPPTLGDYRAPSVNSPTRLSVSLPMRAARRAPQDGCACARSRSSFMNKTLATLVAAGLGVPARAGIVYNQPPHTNGVLYQSSYFNPDGSDYDQYVWDNFTLASATGINRV